MFRAPAPRFVLASRSLVSCVGALLALAGCGAGPAGVVRLPVTDLGLKPQDLAALQHALVPPPPEGKTADAKPADARAADGHPNSAATAALVPPGAAPQVPAPAVVTAAAAPAAQTPVGAPAAAAGSQPAATVPGTLAAAAPATAPGPAAAGAFATPGGVAIAPGALAPGAAILAAAAHSDAPIATTLPPGTLFEEDFSGDLARWQIATPPGAASEGDPAKSWAITGTDTPDGEHALALTGRGPLAATRRTFYLQTLVPIDLTHADQPRLRLVVKNTRTAEASFSAVWQSTDTANPEETLIGSRFVADREWTTKEFDLGLLKGRAGRLILMARADHDAVPMLDEVAVYDAGR